jgi:hypothetical protein
MSLLGLLSGTGSYPVEGYILFALAFFLVAWIIDFLIRWISSKPWRKAKEPIGEMYSSSENETHDPATEGPNDSTRGVNLYGLIKSQFDLCRN